MIYKKIIKFFLFIMLFISGCAEKRDTKLLNIIDRFQTLFSNEELQSIKNLHPDSLYDGNFETYQKYLLVFNEENDNLESTKYFNSKNISMAVGFKYDLLVIATHYKLNNKNELINFSYLRANVLYRSKQLNKSR
jgi:hypothetical protein